MYEWEIAAHVAAGAWDACRQYVETSPGRPCQCERLPATSVYCQYLCLCTPVNSDGHDKLKIIIQLFTTIVIWEKWLMTY